MTQHIDTLLTSIVVPAYNVECYLDECVQSIIDQSSDDWELIIVDDGSTDATPQLCDAWGAKDERISVVHTENRGLSAARNTGFKQAKGQWVWFVDSDDSITENAIDLIGQAAQERDCDLIAFGLVPFNETGELPLETLGFSELSLRGTMPAMELEKLLYQGKRGHYTQTYVYRISALQSFQPGKGPFDEKIKLFEDVAFIHQYVRDVENAYVIDQSLYLYRQTPGSLLHHGNAMRAASGLCALETVLALEIAPELEAYRAQMLVRFIMSIDTLAGDSPEALEVRKQARELLGTVLNHAPKGSLPFTYRVKCALMRMGIYHQMRKLLIRLGVIRAWNEV